MPKRDAEGVCMCHDGLTMASHIGTHPYTQYCRNTTSHNSLEYKHLPTYTTDILHAPIHTQPNTQPPR
ncbi:Hypothetical predicted protein [Pelobates cultripes]|uniref:Uncharacterized protein n=1 Tax=Pelobates cultripes TaxID=61616 RepID=A0AAD1R9S0_PELCU|nr:Hypothetical predicted protein [Pelobates cultripes]